MTTETSPYSPGIVQERISLAEPVITYFQQRGMFIRSLSSYEQIRGRDSAMPIEIMEDWRFGKYVEDSYPLENASEEAKKKAEKHSQELLSRFTRNNPSQISKIKRDFMISGLTLPIRLNALIDREIKATVYVKKPSTERIFGVLLYNLLSGHPPQDFIFNCYSFVERAVLGEHLGDENFRRLIHRPKFKESIVRLSELDDLLSINDLDRRSGINNSFPNILFSYDGEAYAFDFNTILQPEVEGRSTLVETMREAGVDITSKFEKQIRREESLCLNARIHKNRPCFESIVKLIDSIPYMQDRIQEKGYHSAKEFFKDRLGLLMKDASVSV